MEEEAKSTEIRNNTQLKTPVPAKPQIQSNKRKLAGNADLRNSAYFKVRALTRQLRPQFIQVLQTPDFRNCKAAYEIKLQMKLVVDLYKQMIAERPSSSQNVLGTQSSCHEERKKLDLLQPKKSLDESMEKKPQTPPSSSDKALDDICQGRESYIVGGSAIGWNFITFSGSKQVYYGVSKESFRRSQKMMTDQSLPISTEILDDKKSDHRDHMPTPTTM